METCPSTFTLDDREIHGAPADDAVGRHVASCTRCGPRVAERAALARRFDAQLREPLWRRVVATPRRRRWWPLGLLAPAVAAAAVLVMARAPSGPTVPYSAVKGQPGIELAGRRQSRVFAFGAGVEALPGDELQVTVRAAHPGDAYVVVGSVDGTGTFFPFYPAALDARSVPLPPPGQPLAPPIVLDAAPGPERIVVVRSARPLPVRAVAAAAVAAAARQESFTVTEDASADVRWIVLPKRSGGHAPGGPR